MAEKTNQGMQSTFSLARATARMADAIKASDVILEATEEEL